MAPKAKAKARGGVGAGVNKFIKKVSSVKALDDSGTVFKGYFVWSDKAPGVVARPEDLFAKCLVQPGSTNDRFRLKQMDPSSPAEEGEFFVEQSNVWNFNSNLDALALPDIGLLPHTNIPCVLDYLRQRYMHNEIYATADPLLIAVNPFKNIGNATDEYIVRYRDVADVSTLQPHCFSTARTAMENLHALSKNQTIIVSGESGAGKTEATKMMMRFFAAAKSGTLDLRIQKAVMAANPVLEAFGNAKTIRNNNSSRFGRFMQLQLAKGGGIQYGSVRNFLLEKSRLVSQDENDRSYHIFYFMARGMPAEAQKCINLLKLTDYHMINPKCLDAPGIDDVEEFAEVEKAFDSMLLSPDEKQSIYSLVSGVLLLGNVEIIAVSKDGVPDAGAIAPASKATFETACKLLFLDPAGVEEGLTAKISFVGGSEVRGMWRMHEAIVLRDSLAKGVYDKLFDWIVRRLNNNIEPPEGFTSFLGMLDIFGFEVFRNNSLEQMFINITNEMLQKNFTDVVFEREQKLYQKEGVSCADLIYSSNAKVIEVLTGKGASLMSVLEDQCLAPGGSDEKLLGTAYRILAANDSFVKPKVAPNINFVVAHTIGDIQYCVTGFLFKNKDVLRAELVELLQASQNSVAAALFEGITVEKGKSGKGQLIGSQFLAQLERLMAIINATEPHFVRCVKPNETKKPLDWNSAKVLIQLHSLSILDALQLREIGFSYRRPFEEFLQQFRFVHLGLSSPDDKRPAKAKAKEMVQCAKVTAGVAYGETMVFMKSAAAKQIANAQRARMAAWVPLVQLLEACAEHRKHRLRYYKDDAGTICRLQALVRMKNHGANVPATPFHVDLAGWPARQSA